MVSVTASSQRIALHVGPPGQTGVVYYLHTDHPSAGSGQALGSASLTTNDSGGEMPGSRTGYYPFGEMRYGGGGLPTDRRFTGQRLEAGLGLYDYHARFYDPTLGRFVSADTIVPNPGNPQDLNRYAYVRNNPLKYTDPSGHAVDPYGNSTRLVSLPPGAKVDPEKVRETAVFLAVGVPMAVFGGPILGDIGAIGAGAIGCVAAPTAAMIKARLMFGAAGGAGSGLGYAVPSILAGDFDWREFAVATGVGFASGAFPDVGGSGVVAGTIRGVLANEAQYVLSSAWTGEEMSWKEAQWAAGAGVLTGGASECIGISASAHFNSAMTQAELFNWRSVHGAANFARDSLEAYVTTASGPALQEGGRTWLWETVNNMLTTDYSD